MKLSTQIAKLKIKKAKATRDSRTVGKSSRFLTWKRASVSLGLVVAVGLSWTVLNIFVWHRLPGELVGTWEVQAGPMQGGTFQFLSDGGLVIRSGQGPEMKASAELDGKTLLTTTQNPGTLREETRKSTIQELTATSLILVLERGDVLQMLRKQ